MSWVVLSSFVLLDCVRLMSGLCLTECIRPICPVSLRCLSSARAVGRGVGGALARGLRAFPHDPTDHSTSPFILSSAGVPDQRTEPTFATRPPAAAAAGDLVENPILPRRQVALRCQPGQQGLEPTAGQQVNETAREGPRSAVAVHVATTTRFEGPVTCRQRGVFVVMLP